MQIRFYIDPGTNLPHIYNHNVTEDEVKDILTRPGEDRPVAEKVHGWLSVKRKRGDIYVLYMYRTTNRIVFL